MSRSRSPRPPSKKASTRLGRFLESDDYVITWAVGHLVELAEPEEYDAKFKKWRMADLPIVPERFRSCRATARPQKQLERDPQAAEARRRRARRQRLRRRARGRADLRLHYENAGGQASRSQRLWLELDDEARRSAKAFGHLRPGERAAAARGGGALALRGRLARRHERDARGDDPRLRRAFDGAVSLGRVQTPTLAMIVRREREIQALRRPSRTGSSTATFAADRGRGLRRAATSAAGDLPKQEAADAIVAARAPASPATIAKLEKTEQRERPPLLYDLTVAPARREHALRLLRAPHARRPRSALRGARRRSPTRARARATSRATWSRELKPTAGARRRRSPSTHAAPSTCSALDELPLGRVVNDAKVTDHHAIIPTRSEQRLEKLTDDERKIYDLVARRFLAVFHPEAVFERTRVETTVAEQRLPHARPACSLEAGLARPSTARSRGPERSREDDEGGDQSLPKLEQGEAVETRRGRGARRKETQPPRRYTEASLLAGDGDRRQAHRRRASCARR